MNDQTDTLSDGRTAQMRDLLTEEIRADAAPTLQPGHAPRRATPRRIAVGATAALIIGGMLFGVNAIAGGPGGSATPQALAIESSDGTTTVRLDDLDASPDEVMAELEAAGIPARLESIGADGSGPIFAKEGDDFAIYLGPVAFGDQGELPGNAEGLIGLTAEAPDGEWFQSVLPFVRGTDGPSLVAFDSIVVPECRDDVLGESDAISEACAGAISEPQVIDLKDRAIQLHDDGSVTIDDSSGAAIVVIARG